MDDPYLKIRKDTHWTGLQDRAYKSTYLLRDHGFFTTDQAELVRQHLSTAWDPYRMQSIDLLYPDNPRAIVRKANAELALDSQMLWRSIRENQIHQYTVDHLLPPVDQLPEFKRLLSQLGPADPFRLSRARVLIYGQNASDWWNPDSDSIFIPDGEHLNIAVPPNHFGLSIRLLELWTKVFVLGPRVNEGIGWPLIGASFQFFAENEHPSLIALKDWIDMIAEESGVDPIPLAKAFILGNPQPIFSFLDGFYGPLGTALLIFIADDDATDLTLDRLLVFNTLCELEKTRP